MRGAIPSTMQAWQSPAPGLAALQLVPLTVPKADDRHVLIKVSTAALNFSDALMIYDRYQVRPPRPFVPGQEVAGRVVAAGADSGFRIGDAIASKVDWGGFAEYALVRRDMAIPVPQTLSLAQASALPVVYTTAMVALTVSTTIKRGDTVLVLAAAGGVGLASVEIARHFGARVIAAAGGPEKCALAKQHGAHESVDYRSEGWSEAVKTLTGGNGVDVIVDPVGGAVNKEALRALGWNARILIVGFSSGDIPQIPANRLLLKRASAIGVYWNHDRDAGMLADATTKLTDLARTGAIKPHIGATFALNRLPQALASLAGRRSTGKVVVNVSAEDTTP